MTPNGGLPVRCTCATHPLLAKCGRDETTGEPWVHVKVWKGKRLYSEMVVTSGVVQIRCRECLRWYRIKIVRGAPVLREESGESLPGVLATPPVDAVS